MTEEAVPVQPGDALPFCFGMATDRTSFSLEGQAGRAAVIMLMGDTSVRSAASIVQGFMRHADSFAVRNADILLIGNEDLVRPLASGLPAPCPVRLIDAGLDFLGRCGVRSGETALLVIDRNRRIALRLSPVRESDATAALDCLDRLPYEAPRDIVLPAPVLILPHLLPAPLCRDLIGWFESHPSMEGEIASIDSAGLAQSRVDRAKKSRRDVPVAASAPLYDMLRATLLRRCAPEIARAFHGRITQIDRLLIARYDDTGGWFRRHRDDVGESVAFREFAVSVNLNTEDYEGGHLIFPEYNDHRYRPPTGAAAIFSASVLHEATPVTRGRRYVLLTFFYGEAAQERRKTRI